VLVVSIVLALCGPLSRAEAAPPPNDAPSVAGVFEPYTAENGRPRALQAIAELAEATPDAGVPRCLGPSSFARTVWYVIPPAESPQSLTVEASGRTLAAVDLAAFVQPEAAPGPLTREPNVCSGAGASAVDGAAEPTSAVTLRVPARRGVLIEVGRRGPVGSADDERAVLSLDARPLVVPGSPPGDSANSIVPTQRAHGPSSVALGGSTITEEDPAEPACPAAGTVWRRLQPGHAGPRLVSVSGGAVSSLTVFEGPRPTAGDVLDCVVRQGLGALQMLVSSHARRPLWIRVGTDSPADDSVAELEVVAGYRQVIDGGPGGFDPTRGGPGGGFPDDCAVTVPERARVIAGKVTRAASRGVTLGLRVRGSRLCDVAVALLGPGGHVYASGQAISVKGHGLVLLEPTGKLVSGSYRVRVTAVSQLGRRVPVRSSLRVRL